MAYIVAFHPDVEADVDESYNWYEDRLQGLGDRFINAIGGTIEIICEQPDIYPKKKGNYREATLKDFPFVVVYEVLRKEQVVRVLYIFHTSRNPKLKYKRR